ncbi:hypothetical protein ARALYDRAFT_918050 [Arabidopsis lyrata subsp. lyrata]|uniref:Embryo surrounding factor 1 brassicaceae domain-containing protein n=1 Tax=Arabidopsis lyrata subsp. lyrata TaxID=81972 RepID=D7MQ56_ARALL|nr:EMBRYO SURROUNDING FACTOR 1-like protein 11 [Arabidopsis lyrata subsp. lyrata]EFH40316.1 hypothetical protein ARALYDRAFT_918050 [Arabidopsis lyrata subsp. lyrata]|eukprot:XP_002864057.1 EMBRYO SURROUNDING FACTOR 1-like protein 11 [Arabidopsis lyrata subsp. lyrata]
MSSSSHFAIFCIIFVSSFVLHECENMVEDIDASKIVIYKSPCVRTRCSSFSFLWNCHCCRGKFKKIKVCEAECLRLNPPITSS